jgi:hypothetical protein
MLHRRLLLIEALDSLGAHEADARLRSFLLRRAGHDVRALVGTGAVPGGLFRELGPGAIPGAPLPLAEVLLRVPRSLVIVPASRHSATAITGALPPDFGMRWWPTEVLDAGEPIELPGRRVEPLFPPSGAAMRETRPEQAWPLALECAAIAPGHHRERDALWDGDYLLVPAPLAGPDGATVLEAFARVADGHDELDLVVLTDPQPEFGALARELGVGTRVHFAGPATREAEHIWLASASAAVLAYGGPLSAGWVMRALARGCPLLPVGGSALVEALRRWLAAGGCLLAPEILRPEDLVAALEVVLGSDRAATVAIERGRGMAAAAAPAAVVARLVAAVDAAAEDPRRAA